MTTVELLKSELASCEITEGKLYIMITYNNNKELRLIKNVLYVLGHDGNFMTENNVVTIKK